MKELTDYELSFLPPEVRRFYEYQKWKEKQEAR